MAFRTQKEKKAFRVGVIAGAKKATNRRRKTRVVVRSLKKRKARKIRR